MQDTETYLQRRLIRFPEVRRLTSYSRTTLWRMERAGVFPQRVRCGSNGVGWYLHEVLAHLDALPRVALANVQGTSDSAHQSEMDEKRCRSAAGERS